MHSTLSLASAHYPSSREVFHKLIIDKTHTNLGQFVSRIRAGVKILGKVVCQNTHARDVLDQVYRRGRSGAELVLKTLIDEPLAREWLEEQILHWLPEARLAAEVELLVMSGLMLAGEGDDALPYERLLSVLNRLVESEESAEQDFLDVIDKLRARVESISGSVPSADT